MNFVAFNFKTATGSLNSACEIGCARVVEGRVVETFSSLIQPPRNEFHDHQMRYHRVTPDMTAGAPTFGELWPTIKGWFCVDPIVAHQSSFHVGVLKKCLENSGNACPELDYFCTVRFSQKILPEYDSHELPSLAESLGVPINHHHAGPDAITCAEIAIILLNKAGQGDIKKALRNIAKFGTHEDEGWDFGACGRILGEVIKQKMVSKYSLCLERGLVPDGRFDEKQFVFTGRLACMRRAEAKKMVELYGGIIMPCVSGNTDYVVVGYQYLYDYRKTRNTTIKLKKAMKFRDKGGKVKIMREPKFLKMIGY